MGYDCTLHVVDEAAIRQGFVPWLLGRDGDTAFERRRPGDAAALRDKVWRAVSRGEADAGALVCQLAVMWSAAALPHVDERGFALSLWRERLPSGIAASPTGLFGELANRHPKLRFPTAFESNYTTGVFIPASSVSRALAWVNERAAGLKKGDRRQLLGLVKVLRTAARLGLAYWEATDLDVLDTDPASLDGGAPAAAEGTLTASVDVGAFSDAIAFTEDLALLSDGSALATTLVDLSSWPPRATTDRACFAVQGARGPEGSWLVLSTRALQDRPRRFTPRIIDASLARASEVELSLPGEAAQASSFAGCGWVGDRAVVFPSAYDVAAGRIVRPLVQDGGDLREEPGLPAGVTTQNVIGSPQIAFGCAALAGGETVLVWSGDGWEWRAGDGWRRTFELGAAECAGGYGAWTTVPAGTDGFFYLDDRCLFEVHRGGRPTRHLPKQENIMQLAPGPEGTLLLHEGDNPQGDVAKLYVPAEGAYVSIEPELFGWEQGTASWVRWVPALGRIVACENGRLAAASAAVVLAGKKVTPRVRASRRRS